MSSTRRLVTVILALLAFTGGIIFIYQVFQGVRVQPSVATVWPMPKPLPDFSLMDDSGNTFNTENLQGHWSLLFFGFTHCPDICPATLQQLALVTKRLQESGKASPDVYLVSVDPERDTPEVMASYVRHFGSEIHGITGDIGELRKLTSAAGIFFEKSTQPDGSYSVDHSAAVLLINENGAIHASFGAPHDIRGFVNDLPILMGSN
jgi:protein SCO1/2